MFRARVLLVVLAPLALFAAFEFVVDTLDLAPPRRSPVVVWNPKQDKILFSGEGEFRPDPRWLWEPRPGAVVHGDVIHSGAYRGPRVPEERGTALRILAFGDSTTWGFGLPEAMAWPRVLEKVLRAFGVDVEVVNFGVLGFTLEQGYRLYVGKGRRYRPDVVVVAFGAVNEQFPTRLTDAEKIDLLSSPLRRAGLFLERYESFRWLEEKLVPKRPVDALDEGAVRVRMPPDRFERRLAEWAELVRGDGARCVVVCPPRRGDAPAKYPRCEEYTRRLHAVVERLGLPLAEVHDAFEALDREELGSDWRRPAVARTSRLFQDYWHPTVAGHRAYALLVGRALAEARLLPGIDPDKAPLPEVPGAAAAGSGGR